MHTKKKGYFVPAALTEVALIDAQTACNGGGMSVSWWHAKVAAGEAPAPAVRLPRCTRWKLTEVSQFWSDFAAQNTGQAQGSSRVLAQAVTASEAARKKRRLTPQVQGEVPQ